MEPSDDVIHALTAVVRAERERLCALARREGLSREDAVDCVQDAFCTYLVRAIRGDLPRETAAFLAGVVKNGARNKRRRHHVARPHVPLEDDFARDVADDDALDERLARAEDHVRLRACVDRLCDTQRAVVTLRMLEERDGEDVAAALGVTRNHVDVLLHRARSSLAACMME